MTLVCILLVVLIVVLALMLWNISIGLAMVIDAIERLPRQFQAVRIDEGFTRAVHARPTQAELDAPMPEESVAP